MDEAKGSLTYGSPLKLDMFEARSTSAQWTGNAGSLGLLKVNVTDRSRTKEFTESPHLLTLSMIYPSALI